MSGLRARMRGIGGGNGRPARGMGRIRRRAVAAAVAVIMCVTFVPALRGDGPWDDLADRRRAPGASAAAPAQRTGAAGRTGPRVGSGATRATARQAPRKPARPPGAVPDRRPVPPAVKRPAPARPRTVNAPITQRPPAAAAAPAAAAGPAGRAKEIPGMEIPGMEIPGERTAATRTFRNPDGTRTLRTYAQPVNVRRPDGGWDRADLGLRRDAAGRLGPRIAPYTASFAPVAAADGLASLGIDDDHAVTFGLRGTAAARAAAKGSTVTYPGVRPEADLELNATGAGLKENIVLRSAKAPTSYEFTLRLRGLRARADEGAVRLVDAAGRTRAIIPPGFMEDARGRVSHGVRYELTGDGALRVDLDAGWLRAADRAYPIKVDPAIQLNTDADDTYVRAGSSADHSREINLEVGGPQNAIAFMRFGEIVSRLRNQYIQGAALNVLNTFSGSCEARSVSLHEVAQSWSGDDVRDHPGPRLGRLVQTRSFAHAASGCATPQREKFDLNPDTVTGWTHGAPFHGLALRGDAGAAGFKRFASAQAAAANVPFLDVRYAAEGASYVGGTTRLPSNNNPGSMAVIVTNRGSSTWTPANGFKLGYTVKRGTAVVHTSPRFAAPATVRPNARATFTVPLPALPPADYTAEITMFDPQGRDFHAAYGVPYGILPFKVVNEQPAVDFEQPGTGAEVPTTAPTLYAEGVDPDGTVPNDALKFQFLICGGTPEARTDCRQSGWTGHAWTPPARLRWNETYFWWVRANDGTAGGVGPWVGPLMLTTVVPQPEITSHLAGSPDMGEAPGLDPQLGNYSTVATDARVPGAGPALSVTRTYNSLDPRRDTAFGAGWSSWIDMKVVRDGDGSGNAVVTLADGRQVRFGANPDGGFAPPPGESLTLVRDSATGRDTLRSAGGPTWTFDVIGRLIEVKDADGLAQTLTYDVNDHVRAVRNETSGRQLTLTWQDPATPGGHVTAVAAPAPGGTWTYTYAGDRLAAACAPGAACTTYGHQSGSHYRGSVIDDNPRAYWRLGESGGTRAASVTARADGADAGTYVNAGLGAAGGPAGGADTAASFHGAGAYVTLPQKLTTATLSGSVELWFKTTSWGVLLSEQSAPVTADPAGGYVPLLYVDTGGTLRGGFWTGAQRQITSKAPVNDGRWHHVALSSAINTQTMYVDGVAQGTLAGVVDHLAMNHLTLGAGKVQNWPGTTGGTSYFTGSIDEAAVYWHTLGPNAARQHYEAGARASEGLLTSVTLPQDGRRVVEIGYDGVNERVRGYTDGHGRTWTLDPLRRQGAVRTAVLKGPYPDYVYTFDADHAGRITSRSHNGSTRTYEYNSAGFLSELTDENGHAVSLASDERGNVLSRTTCRDGDTCNSEYFSYFTDDGRPLDPRNDRMTSRSDARSAGPGDARFRTRFGYDAAGRQTSVRHPAPAGQGEPIETFTYATGAEDAAGGGKVPAGLLIKSTGRRGQATTHSYRATGDLAETVSPTGLRTKYTHDDLGRIATRTLAGRNDAAFGTTSFEYTPRSQLAKVTEPRIENPVTGVTHQKVTSYDYDANGNVARLTLSDAAGGDPARITTYGYDRLDRLAATTYPDGGTETRQYSADALRMTVTDVNGTRWTDSYDDHGRLTGRTASAEGADPMDPSQTSLTIEQRSYDPAGRPAAVTDAMNRRTTFTYFDDGLLATRVADDFRDPGGTTRDIVLESRSYDPAGNLTRLDEPGGRTTTHAYDPAGYVETTAVDPANLNRVTTYQRDRDGNPLTVTRTGAAQPGRAEVTEFDYDEANLVTRRDDKVGDGFFVSTEYGRDERGLIKTETDPRHGVTDYGYDASGAPAGVTRPAVDTWVAGVRTAGVRPRTLIGRNAFGEESHGRDANGAITVTGHDVMGRATATTRPPYVPPGGTAITATTRFEHDRAGNITKITDPLGRETTRRYDPYGRVLAETRPAVGDQASTTAFRYDRVGEMLARTSPSGAQTLFTYDDLGRRITETGRERFPGPLSFFTTTTRYDDAGNPISVTTPEGNTRTAQFNAVGEVAAQADATGRTWRFGYDIAGRRRSSADPGGLTTESAHDLLGRETGRSQRAASGTSRTASADYDDAGNLVARTSPEGRRVTYGHDALNRRTSMVERPDADTTITTALGYDAAGNRTRVVDGRGNATDHTFTPWGLPESIIEPATAAHPAPADRTFTTVYDAAGRAVRESLPGGVVRTRTFDEQDRPVAEHGSGGQAAADRTFGHDADGRLDRQGDGRLDGQGDTTYRYDDRGNLLQSSDGATFAYNGDGTLARRADAAGTATFTYDKAGRLASLADPLTGRTAAYGYDSAGRPATRTDQTSQVTTQTRYDDLGRMKSQDVGSAFSIAYKYDRDDNLVESTTTAGGPAAENTYGYDGAGRLTSWKAPSGSVTEYGWDASGNRTEAGGTTYAYDERNRLTSDGTSSYTYTPRGTLASAGSRTLSFDAFDRLVADGPVEYSYDGLDRVAERDGAGFRYAGLGNDLVSDGSRLVTRDPDGAPIADRAAGSGTAKWLLADQHDNVVLRHVGTDVTDRRDFDPFGGVAASAGERPSLGYQSGWTDPSTGQVNMAARWYDPDTGTFPSRDSLTLDPDPSTNANRYLYAAANPLAHTDPTGHGPREVGEACLVGMVNRGMAYQAVARLTGPWGLAASCGLGAGGVLLKDALRTPPGGDRRTRYDQCGRQNPHGGYHLAPGMDPNSRGMFLCDDQLEWWFMHGGTPSQRYLDRLASTAQFWRDYQDGLAEEWRFMQRPYHRRGPWLGAPDDPPGGPRRKAPRPAPPPPPPWVINALRPIPRPPAGSTVTVFRPSRISAVQKHVTKYINLGPERTRKAIKITVDPDRVWYGAIAPTRIPDGSVEPAARPAIVDAALELIEPADPVDDEATDLPEFTPPAPMSGLSGRSWRGDPASGR